MRINQYVARATGVSRRGVDTAIKEGRVVINGQVATLGQSVNGTDQIALDGKNLQTGAFKLLTIILNKPAGYVCSRNGQGSKTIYDLLPKEMHNLKPVGRLDKDSSGLILLTNDGNLANQLTHPKFAKEKVYEVKLNKPLLPEEIFKIKTGVLLEDGLSKLEIKALGTIPNTIYQIRMHEGRNRQIRRTFAATGHNVTYLHRRQFGPYKLGKIASGSYQIAK